MSIAVVAAFLLPWSWLLPNHYFPWPSAWQDGFALAVLLVAALSCRSGGRVHWPWLALTAAISASATGQWLTGRILYGGDAILVLLYAVALALSLVVGYALVAVEPPDGKKRVLGALACGVLVPAMLSAGIAMAQWTGSVPLGLFGADLPSGARPFANVSQPNHLCSLLFLGLCAAILLRECGRIGNVGFWFANCWMLCGMVMSGSRTGWLQMGVLVALGVVLGRRVNATVRPPHLLVSLALFVGATLAWPHVNEVLLLSGGRGVAEQIDGGARGPLWRALLDAVGHEPLWGYGWQQVTLAQQAVALDHPAIQRHFEHSHNLVLDVLLWTGIPTAVLICSLAFVALRSLLHRMCDPRALWLVIGVLGLLAHAMLEFPLEYAYFLLPAGLALGAATALGRGAPPTAAPAWAVRMVAAAAAFLLTAIAIEYLQAEQSHRLLRLETARIGTSGIESTAPDLQVLTQLRAFLRFARTEAKPGMSTSEMDQMRRAATRFNYPPSMLRHALAAGLNGQPDEARLTLLRLCRIHPQPRCDEARAAWSTLQRLHPVLLLIPAP